MSTYTELQAWLNGTVNGGPNGDGRYPLTYADGLTYLVYCPAAQALNPAYAEQPVEIFASAAGTSAGEAAASAAEADQDRIDAQTAAANAAASASTANTHKNAAATSATNAATSATNAANSATAAGTSETNAAGSATAAAGSATTASGHATTANTAKTAAETARDRAQKWADEAVDVVVEAGKYSAKHWASKAAETIATGHTHSIANVTGLQAALDGKASLLAAVAFQDVTATRGGVFGALWLGSDSEGYLYRSSYRTLDMRAGDRSWYFTGAGGTVWTTGDLPQPMTQNTTQNVTAGKTFTAQQTVDNCTFNFRNWAGVGTNGLVLLGDSSYLWKVGSEFQLYNAQGGFTATISSGGTVLTTVNAPNAQDTNNGARLGKNAATIGDWNNATHNGWYMAAGALNAPIAGIWFMGRVTHHNDAWIQQEAWCFTEPAETTRFRRVKRNGTWEAWTSKITADHQIAATSRVYAMEGAIDSMPAKRVMQLLYIPAVFDGGILSAYDYGNPGYKPIKIEAASLTYVDAGGNTRVAMNTSDGYRMLQVAGGISSQGTTAQLECIDRTSGRGWVFYATGDQFYLWNGNSNVISYTTLGGANFNHDVVAGSLRPSSSNGAHFAGNGSGIQLNGNLYNNGLNYDLAANGAVWVPRRKIFVGTTVDINQMAEGDLFVEI